MYFTNQPNASEHVSAYNTHVDYRCEDRKKLVSYEAALVSLDRSLLFLSKNLYHHSSKNEPFSQEMHLKIPLSSLGLKLSNPKPGCEVSALHFFVK
jgi:hypothetical protein